MRRRVLAVALAALVPLSLVTATPADAHRPPVELRVATYNIHAGAGEDGVFDVDRTVGAIAGLHADVVAMQEVDVHWDARSQWRDLAGELADRLDMHVYFGPIYHNPPAEPGAPDREYGNALLSRYPIRWAANHEITRLSTQDPDPVPEPAPGFPEIVVNVRGVPVHVYSTHLDYRSDPLVRTMQVADTLEVLARHPGRPAVVMGDFNTEHDAPELGPLWDSLTDAWTAAGHGDGFTYPAVEPLSRIDMIAVSDSITVSRIGTVDTTASDHRPVVATLRLPR